MANNDTSPSPHPQTGGAGEPPGGGSQYLYILIVMSFYGVFLCGVLLGYVRSKRREKKKPNFFTHLIYEEEKREWGAAPKKHSLTLGAPGLRGLPFGGALYDSRLPAPLACAFCTAEHSSVSSLCSSDVHLAIEEEAEGGAQGGPGDSDEAAVLRERS